MMVLCNICHGNTVIYEKIQNCRADSLSFSKNFVQQKFFDAELYSCKNCGHFFITGIDTSKFYTSDYNELSGFRAYYGLTKNTREDSIKKIFSYAESNDNLNYFDIGCGTGDILSIAKKYFKNVYGIEPSNNYIAAKNHGFNIIHDFFDKNTEINVPIQTYSLFQVLEHINEPQIFIENLFNRVQENSIGLINVPNGEYIIDNCRYDQIYIEHINYFTPKSILQLATSAGFKILELYSEESTLELYLYIRKPEKHHTSEKSFNEAKNRDVRNVQNKLKNFKSIALWGAGGKAISFATLLPPNLPIKYFFDNDPCKYGLYLPGINRHIEDPTLEKISSCDAIIIFAKSYAEEITNELVNDYNFSGEIISV